MPPDKKVEGAEEPPLEDEYWDGVESLFIDSEGGDLEDGEVPF